MSVLDVLARPRTGSANGRTAGADLRLVPRTRTRPPRVPFVLLVLVLLGVGLVGLLLVNTQLQQGSFVLHDLERKLSDVRDREAALEREVATLEAPQTLASRAAALGMVPNPSPGYLVVGERTGSTGDGGELAAVSGNPEPAPTPEPPPAPTPPAGTGNEPESGDNGRAGGQEPAGGQPDGRGRPNQQANQQPNQQQEQQPNQQPNQQPDGPANDGQPTDQDGRNQPAGDSGAGGTGAGANGAGETGAGETGAGENGAGETATGGTG